MQITISETDQVVAETGEMKVSLFKLGPVTADQLAKGQDNLAKLIKYEEAIEKAKAAFKGPKKTRKKKVVETTDQEELPLPEQPEEQINERINTYGA